MTIPQRILARGRRREAEMELEKVCGNCKHAVEKTCGHCWTPALYCTNEKSDVNLRHSIFEGHAACKKWAAKAQP